MANSSYYISGKTSTPPKRAYEPIIDKNPVYRTNDTFKRAYKKNISVQEGQYNCTDCVSTIWVKFADPVDRVIVEDAGMNGTRRCFLLECGHVWEGKKDALPGQTLPCMVCGAEQGYLGFEHEWQHILFKTNPEVAKVFVTSWASELRKDAPHVDQAQLEQFLFYVLNAFDDVRCNSLWELLYPGSADRIWQRWTRISSSRGPAQNSQDFVAFLFAVALGTPTLPDGPFEDLRSYIEWGMQNVRYKGYQRALLVAKMAMDYCMRAMIARLQPSPQQQAQDQGDTNGQSQEDSLQVSAHGDGSDTGAAADGSSRDAEGSTGEDGRDGLGQTGGSVPASAQTQSGSAPEPQNQGEGSSASQQVTASNALSSLLRHSSPFDTHESHFLPDKPDLTQLSDSARASLAQIIKSDTGDSQLEADIQSTAGLVDQDMQNTIDQFRDGMTHVSPDSQLMADAKARVVLIDVQPDGISKNSQIVLTDKENDAVDRMRGVFFRTLGRQKNQRSASGTSIDIDAAIQYEIDPSDSEIFEQENNNQGFAYMTLCDMSGSMSGERFRQVCHATEMLKKSLRFPFVSGNLWGFRGGSGHRIDRSSEVWIYRYNKNCEGYVGIARIPGKSYTYPVQCDGLTPMHSAVRVAVKYMLMQVSPGMVKRVFLLTDGSPCSVKTDGKGLPHWVLQQYVAKEIQWARQKGIQVYTLVIDGGLEERECRTMFGPPRYWRNVLSNDDDNSIDRVLQNLVIQNFERYLRSRG